MHSACYAKPDPYPKKWSETVSLDLRLYFAPQRRPLFRHPHLQKCSESSRHSGAHFLNISTFKSVPNMKCLWRCDFTMSFAPQQCAIFDLSSHHMAPRPHFSEPTFLPAGTTRQWKTQSFQTFLPLREPCSAFSRAWLFFLLTLSLRTFSSLIFFLLPFSSLALPTSDASFSYIVGSLTSNFPPVMIQ